MAREVTLKSGIPGVVFVHVPHQTGSNRFMSLARKVFVLGVEKLISASPNQAIREMSLPDLRRWKSELQVVPETAQK